MFSEKEILDKVYQALITRVCAEYLERIHGNEASAVQLLDDFKRSICKAIRARNEMKAVLTKEEE